MNSEVPAGLLPDGLPGMPDWVLRAGAALRAPADFPPGAGADAITARIRAAVESMRVEFPGRELSAGGI